MITQEFIIQCILQHTKQGALEWFINERGGYYAIVDGWSIVIIGNNKFVDLTYQKGLKIGHIKAGIQGLYNIDTQELKEILQLLLKQIKEQLFKDENEETIKVLERQEQKIRQEFCANMLGWNKKT